MFRRRDNILRSIHSTSISGDKELLRWPQDFHHKVLLGRVNPYCFMPNRYLPFFMRPLPKLDDDTLDNNKHKVSVRCFVRLSVSVCLSRLSSPGTPRAAYDAASARFFPSVRADAIVGDTSL